MKLRANCKINLGLRVLRRRPDGFHDIETVMVNVRGLADEIAVAPMPLDFLPSTPPPFSPPPALGSMLRVEGMELDCEPEKNICMRALRLLQVEFGIGEAMMGLRKNIPAGAGLGGGSADAAGVLCALNEEFGIGLTDAELCAIGARLGSDVPFFIGNGGGGVGARLCTGRGEIMEPLDVDMSGKWIAIVKPDVAVSTAEAYAGIVPRESGGALHGALEADGSLSLPEILKRPVGEWRGLLVNDFEKSVFARHPEIGRLKEMLYDKGAMYAAMSGSGAAVFGIFDRRPEVEVPDVFCHIEKFL